MGEGGGLKVLVVDDEPLVAEFMRAFLEPVGHQVTVCLSGSIALAALGDNQFDVAVVDLGLSDMDGWELARGINRAQPGLPIIIATGSSVTVEEGRARGVKISAVLLKPFLWQGLLDGVWEAVGKQRDC